ncbi:MAG: hypothetical protein AAF502_13915 [Bacteroidota bacterium]
MIQLPGFEARDKARVAFEALLNQALSIPGSFDYAFDSLNTISILYPEDRKFRILTWQLCVNSDDFKYYGLIQMNQPELKSFPLVDQSEQVTIPEKEILNPEKWYGALYYNIYQVEHKKSTYYLLFGFDANNLYIRKKLIDVLKFENDQPSFGAPVFVFEEENKPTKTLNRFILGYGSHSTIRLNYDEEHGKIMYDHLIPIGSLYEEQGVIMVPDGSYSALELKKGIWHHVEKVFHQTQEEPPRPNPILDQRKGKGILGQDGNGDDTP